MPSFIPSYQLVLLTGERLRTSGKRSKGLKEGRLVLFMVIFYFCKLMDSGTASAFVADSVAPLNVHLPCVLEHPRPRPMIRKDV